MRLSQPLTLAETKGFIGERFDDGSGLQYLNARYYDPRLAMFVQPDWWEVTQAGVGTNRYSYSFNDPVNGRDPGGHFALSEAELEALVARATTAAGYGFRIALGGTVGALVVALSPTELADGTIPDEQWARQGIALTEGMIEAGWTVNGRGKLVDADGIVVQRGNGAFPRPNRFKRDLVGSGYATRGQQAHHISELNSQDPSAMATREHLMNLGVDPNSAANGVGLTNHAGRHSALYSRKLAERLLGLTKRDELLDELAAIREELQSLDRDISASKEKNPEDIRTATEEWAKQQ